MFSFMKKLISDRQPHIWLVIIFFLANNILFSLAQTNSIDDLNWVPTNNNIDTLPDFYIWSASYNISDHAFSVQACQRNTNISWTKTVTVQASVNWANRSQSVSLNISNYWCLRWVIPVANNLKDLQWAQSIEFTVDLLQQYQESNENNNTYNLSVEFINFIKPDFSIKSIFFDPIEEKVEVAFCQNEWWSNETYFPFVSLQLNNKWIFWNKKVKLNWLDCYTIRRHKSEIELLESWEYKLSARIDYDNEIQETNEQNNNLSKIINISLKNEEKSKEQSYILWYSFIKNQCRYNDKYLIESCGEYELIRKKLMLMTKNSINRITSLELTWEAFQQEINRIQNRLTKLQNNFNYKLTPEEDKRKQFIFEYIDYNIIMLKHYWLNSTLDDFTNDLLK